MCDEKIMAEVAAIKADATAFAQLADPARTTADAILTVFKYKCGVMAVYQTVKEMAAAAKANREAKKAADAASTAG